MGAVSFNKMKIIFRYNPQRLFEKKSFNEVLVKGLCGRGDSNSHARLWALPPQSSASTNFATSALGCKFNKTIQLTIMYLA